MKKENARKNLLEAIISYKEAAEDYDSNLDSIADEIETAIIDAELPFKIIADMEEPKDEKPVAWIKHGPYDEGEPLTYVTTNPNDDTCYTTVFCKK